MGRDILGRVVRLTLLASLAAVVAMPGTGRADDAPVRIVFAGDIMLDGGPGHALDTGRDPLAALAPVFRDADLVVGNLECAVSDKGKKVLKSYTFRAPTESIPLLKRYFSAVCIANNHALDFGREGFVDQLALMEKERLPYFGGGRNRDAARRPCILEARGKRIALLGYCGFPPRSFEAGPQTPGTAWLVEADVLADLKKLQEGETDASRPQASAAANGSGAQAAKAPQSRKPDIVIPYLHWGHEMEPMPDDQQKRLARRFIDAGASAVIGVHPHVPQTVDVYRGRPIVYSLGNCVFDYFPGDPPTFFGWVVRLTFHGKDRVDLETYVVEMDKEGLPQLKSWPPKAR
jgi:poly-gamma-glutamate synthesis protein (capsule biosynthesis protein)